MESYYTDFTYEDLVAELQTAKEVGDEFTILLASKWLRRNITVITSKKDWKVYNNVPDDIVVTYKGKDRYNRGKCHQVNSSARDHKEARTRLHVSFNTFILHYVPACGNSHSAD